MSVTAALALTSMAMSAAGTGLDVYGTLLQGNLAERTGRLNAWATLREADRVTDRLGIAKTQLQKQQKYRMSSLDAEQAELGDGKSAEVMLNAQGLEDALEQGFLSMEAFDQIRVLKQSAAHSYYGGEAAHEASYWTAGTSLLTGAGDLLGKAEGIDITDSIKSTWGGATKALKGTAKTMKAGWGRI